jgi:hypothetical protein
LPVFEALSYPIDLVQCSKVLQRQNEDNYSNNITVFAENETTRAARAAKPTI